MRLLIALPVAFLAVVNTRATRVIHVEKERSLARSPIIRTPGNGKAHFIPISTYGVLQLFILHITNLIVLETLF